VFVDFPIERFRTSLFVNVFRFVQVKVKLIRPFEVEVWVNVDG
jgi:hypothetical protein